MIWIFLTPLALAALAYVAVVLAFWQPWTRWKLPRFTFTRRQEAR